MFERLRALGYEVLALSHAEAILKHDFPKVEAELEEALINFRIPITEIIGSGGGEALGTQRLRRCLTDLKWRKTKFELHKSINGIVRESISHEVDHVRFFPDGPNALNKSAVAMEIEWNNKDPFFDRDLENFKRLHAEGGISIGIILTRGSSLQDSLRGMVLRYAEERNIQSFDDLAALGAKGPTQRQREGVRDRITRSVPPMTFAEAWSSAFVSDKFGQATTHWSKLMDRVRRGVGNPCPLVLLGFPSSIVTFDHTKQILQLDEDGHLNAY